MSMKQRYVSAQKLYTKIGVDTEKAIKVLKGVPISMHCWQGDDITGFENTGVSSGGIQATGNYPGKARTPEELMADMDMALSLVPGRHRINLHGSYAVFKKGEKVDRDKLLPKHFQAWVDFAKKRGLGLDLNPTMFSHPLAVSATLSHVDAKIRKFWIEHCQACIRIGEYFAKELGSASTINIWIPDGLKDVPADYTSPRARLKDSLDKILAMKYDRKKVTVTLESKVFGIGMESYTVGSHEFYLNYAMKNDVLCLLDNGHFHPTESVADKFSSMLLFSDKVALHVTRGIRWDSDHVVRFNDEIRDMANEIVRNGVERFIIGVDFFDASINRVAAWVMGMRNMQKSLLSALLQPHEYMAKLQRDGKFTELQMLQEEVKLYPVGDVWNQFCETEDVPAQEEWFGFVERYEKNVQAKRV